METLYLIVKSYFRHFVNSNNKLIKLCCLELEKSETLALVTVLSPPKLFCWGDHTDLRFILCLN